jgi:hypothetical protein
MKKVTRLVAVLAFLLCFPNASFAARHECSGALDIYGTSYFNANTAHLVNITPNGSCSYLSACLSGTRLYIDFTDKDLFAFAMATEMKGGNWTFMFEDAAPSKGSSYHGSTVCRLEGLRK